MRLSSTSSTSPRPMLKMVTPASVRLAWLTSAAPPRMRKPALSAALVEKFCTFVPDAIIPFHHGRRLSGGQRQHAIEEDRHQRRLPAVVRGSDVPPASDVNRRRGSEPAR